MENGYKTLTTLELEGILTGERPRKPKEVLLTFDHGWASLWTVAAPLLRRYGFRAVAYVIPGRVRDSRDCRPIMGKPGHDPDVDRSEHPFISWGELRKLADERVMDIQSNSWSHAKVFSHDKFLKLIEPETRLPSLSWPLISEVEEPLQFLSPTHVFHPLLPSRSRLSDGLRHEVDPSMVRRIHDDPDAAPFLFKQHFLQIETTEDRERAIRHELLHSRNVLEAKLNKDIRHFAFPWGISGKVAQQLLEECGYQTAFTERRAVKQAVRKGQPPLRLGRLPFPFIRSLPGRHRKRYWRIRMNSQGEQR
ncbi:MAG: polysaccharide deacetylase family protein [Cyanothece sp. SIO2G6]|nr:polysaccharide deacetylase family protein [Cyanothece sp. SIO2G6]